MPRARIASPKATPIVSANPNRRPTETTAIRYKLQNSLWTPPVAVIHRVISPTSISNVPTRSRTETPSSLADTSRQRKA